VAWCAGIGGPPRWDGPGGALVQFNGAWMWHASEVAWPPTGCPCGLSFDPTAVATCGGGVECNCGAVVTRAGQRFVPVATGEA